MDKFRHLPFLVVIFLSSSLFCQIDLSDSLVVPPRKSPLKAGLLSAVIPGGGQFYNQSCFKAGAFITIEGLFLGYAIKNHQKAEKYHDKWKISQSPLDFEKYEDFYEKKQNDIWWLGITIFLSTLDAVTDAYLHDFDYQKERIRLKFKDQAVMIEYKFEGF